MPPPMRRAAFAVGVASFLWAGNAMADRRTHDGFQFRGAVGGGYLADWTSGSGTGSTSVSPRGPAGSLEFYLGATPLPGLTVGLDYNSVASWSSLTSFFASGLYVDHYLDPHAGFHLLGMLGVSQITSEIHDSRVSGEGMGTIGLGVGYDWWVGDEWSIGLLGRVTYAMAGFE